MAPTKRQLQYLQTVVSLYEELGRPVHYSEVAQRLGVSRWTAHDLLTLLSEEGFVEQEYQVRREEPSAGRSSVLFYPTRAAYAELREAQPRTQIQQREDDLRTHLLSKLDQAGKKGVVSVLRETFEELPNLETPLAFCANLVLILVLCIWIAARRNHGALDLDLLTAAGSEEALLILLAGFTLGIVFRGRSMAGQVGVSARAGRRTASLLQTALQDSDQRTQLLSLVEMATKRIASKWSLTGEEDRALLMTLADKAMAKALLS
jgi:DNA-binding MarR family transcriptional regulator